MNNNDLFPSTYVTCLEDVICVLREYENNVQALLDERDMLAEQKQDYHELLFGSYINKGGDIADEG